jgi:hypothetical protein
MARNLSYALLLNPKISELSSPNFFSRSSGYMPFAHLITSSDVLCCPPKALCRPPQALPSVRRKVSRAACLAASLYLILFSLVADISLTIVAVLVTSFRLCIRVRQKRLGLDDAWVALGMICDLLLLIADCLYLQDFCKRLRSEYDAHVLLKKCR